jgi:uncharacterized membrane protein
MNNRSARKLIFVVLLLAGVVITVIAFSAEPSGSTARGIIAPIGIALVVTALLLALVARLSRPRD